MLPSDTSTGTYSIFSKVLNKFDIMFHVSTYIPFNSADTQQVERKRHLGNDVGLIIFKGCSCAYTHTHTRARPPLTQHVTRPTDGPFLAAWCADGGSGDDGFDPLTISSHFNHVFIIVQKVPQSSPTAYRFATHATQPCKLRLMNWWHDASG
jgi:hypothetical protein